MEFTIKKISLLSGVSQRTLRYYDEIGLLKPKRISSSGYRIYGEKEINLLHQILLFKSLEYNLVDIKKIMFSKEFDEKNSLLEHKKNLLAKKNHIENLILNVDTTIKNLERGTEMSNEEKFKEFKNNMIKENEEKYGKEIREKYGDEKIDAANESIINMSTEEMKKFENLASKIIETLLLAMDEGSPTSKNALKAAELHKEWLTMSWGSYDKEIHKNMVQLYVQDDRFKEYYDKHRDGMAAFLIAAVNEYLK